MLTLAFNVQPVKATGTIYIRADGNIDPPTTPIQRDGDYYTLTDNITASADGIVIERDNMILDGTHHTVQGPAPYVAYCKGINLSGRKNVTIKNIEIRAFDFGIYLNYSSDSNIHRNNIEANNLIGLVLQSSSNNGITTNNITYNYYGIQIRGSDNNCISGNQIVRNGPGIGIALIPSSNNTLYHNNFIDNAFDVSSDDYADWDDGYPSGGNYWSDYTGIDMFSGPYQNETGSDGIGDTPYVIDANNQDNYPLMHPLSPLPVHNINTGLGYATIQEAINAPETLDRHAIFVEAGTYYENIVVNKALMLIGENRETTILDGSEIGSMIEVTTDNITIMDFTLRNSGRYADYGGIVLNRVNNCKVTRNIMTDNYNGVWLFYSSNNIISKNSITNNGRGIYLQASPDTNIHQNNLTNNYVGIELDSTSRNDISENSIVSSRDFGLYISTSLGNKIFHNKFVENHQNAFAYWSWGTLWDDGYPSGGNYWSDYTGTDLYSGPYQNEAGSDGIGDTPYIIDGDNKDNYPLVNARAVSRTVALVNVADGSGNFSFSSAQKSVGDTFVVNITIAGAVDLGCWQVGVQWDSSLLSFAAISVPSDNVFADKHPVFAGPDTSVSGLVVYGGSVGPGENGFTGNGTLAQLTLQITQGVGPSEQVKSDIAFESILVDTFLLNSTGSDVTLVYAFNNAHYTYIGQQSETMLGDLNQDGIVDIYDVIQAASAFGSYRGHPNWDSHADLNHDNIIDIFDIIILANNFGKHSF
jgi:parallel beta-helix repeat protein